MNYTLENFIDFCDDYQIAEEGVKETFQKMKAGLIRFFANAVTSLNKKAQSMKESKFKYGILKLCKWATDCLNKSKTLSENDTELAHQLQQDAKELSETMERIKVDETTAQSQTKTTQSGGRSQQSEGETIRTKHATKSKSNKRKSNDDDHLFDEMDQMLDKEKQKIASNHNARMAELNSAVDQLKKTEKSAGKGKYGDVTKELINTLNTI